MLIAKDREGKRTGGGRALAGDDYFCPACGAEVLPKRGAVRVPHFAHRTDNGCAHAAGETELHLEMKQALHDHYSRAPYIARAEVEWRLGDVVADVMLRHGSGARIAVECQVSALEPDELMRRTVAYSRASVHVLWILGGNGALDRVVSRLRNSSGASLSYRAGELERRLQRLYGGRFYYWFNGAIHPLHMEAAERWVGGSCDSCRRQFRCTPEERARCGSGRPARAARVVLESGVQVTLGTLSGWHPVPVECPGGLKLARLRDRRWWKLQPKV